MTIETKSAFYYGFTVTESNRYLNFRDSVAELTATMQVGTYTATEAATEVARALTAASEILQTYTVTFNRTTRTFTISAAGAFDLLPVTGGQSGQSYFGDIGFTTDRSSVASAESDSAAGSEFLPQFRFQDYVDAEDNQDSISEKVNESADGENQEIVRFGRTKTYEFNITLQTNVTQVKGSVIDNDPAGVANLRSFMEFVTDKNRVEFMPDRSDRATFDTLLLESTPSNRNGTGFKLKELIGRVAPGYFETGTLKFRKLV